MDPIFVIDQVPARCQVRENPECLCVAIEPAVAGRELRQLCFGKVAERGVSQIVCEGTSLYRVDVELAHGGEVMVVRVRVFTLESLGQAAGYLRDLEGVDEAIVELETRFRRRDLRDAGEAREDW